jgi:hypothetical protein
MFLTQGRFRQIIRQETGFDNIQKTPTRTNWIVILQLWNLFHQRLTIPKTNNFYYVPLMIGNEQMYTLSTLAKTIWNGAAIPKHAKPTTKEARRSIEAARASARLGAGRRSTGGGGGGGGRRMRAGWRSDLGEARASAGSLGRACRRAAE